MNAPAPDALASLQSAAAGRLEALAAEISALGWPARIDAPPGRIPCLRTRNPEPGAAALSEDIYAAPKAGQWMFWWPWAEPITADPAAAAAIIVRVLRSASTP
jgi:hypothetical protein